MGELKPCPFCSGVASLALCGFGTARVVCMDCGSEGQYCHSREEAIAAWNRRSLIESGESAASSEGILDWIYEDTLPDNYPYEAMFPHSAVIDGVRMFPVFGPHVSASSAMGDDGWRPIEKAPKDGSYFLVTNGQANSSWVAHWFPVAVSGYRFEQPWRSVMLNHNHIEKPARYLPPTMWRPLPAPSGAASPSPSNEREGK